jgi:Protein of Unknown function (DUF2784)
VTLFYRIAAEAVMIAHLGYFLTVVLGLPAIWIGIVRRHKWARNFLWRFGHLSMIAIVVVESWAGITCPLTIWEYQLRELAQQRADSASFMANLVHGLMFFNAPKWVFTTAHRLFGLLVLISFLVAPPQWPWARKSVETP